MSERVAFLFPGQGSYLPGALAEVAGSPAVHEVLTTVDTAAAKYGHSPVSPLVLDPDSPSLDAMLVDAPDRIQLGIFATSVALAAMLDTEYGVRPEVVFGHSFGEVAALTAAGALSVTDGTRMVCERVSALRRAGLPDGGMVAVELSATRTEHLLAAVDDWTLALAGENAPRQSLVSGPVSRLDGFTAAARALEVTVTKLRAPHAFHNPAQRAAADLFATGLQDIPIVAPRSKFYSDLHGRFIDSPETISELLVEHLVAPVRFLSSMRALHDGGVTRFVECGARGVLTGLLAQCLPPVTTVAPLRSRAGREEILALFEIHTSGLPPTKPSATREDGDARRAEEPVEDLITEQLRRMYADALEYPQDVLTDDAELEADLGVDSLKQTSLLSQALDHFGVADVAGDIQPTEYQTIAAVADLLRELRSRQAA
ncbi:acyltransferase domain-containing protein [Saccharomonospora sp. NPDC046836]|uniref:acyltransferase domain-containing protein n=1 Tax=Saccharomonospora sp. NPDC046836 TaxID=3156921 RepID=UPI0033CE1DFB